MRTLLPGYPGGAWRRSTREGGLRGPGPLRRPRPRDRGDGRGPRPPRGRRAPPLRPARLHLSRPRRPATGPTTPNASPALSLDRRAHRGRGRWAAGGPTSSTATTGRRASCPSTCATWAARHGGHGPDDPQHRLPRPDPARAHGRAAARHAPLHRGRLRVLGPHLRAQGGARGRRPAHHRLAHLCRGAPAPRVRHGPRRRDARAARRPRRASSTASTRTPGTPPPTPPIRSPTRRPQGKAANKAALRAEFGLPDTAGPLCVVVSRLTEQKGLDLLIEALPALLRQRRASSRSSARARRGWKTPSAAPPHERPGRRPHRL